VGIGFSNFLFVIGAILTFAVEVDTGSRFNLGTVVEERRIGRQLPLT
jgi:hypothetical protein